MQEIISAALCEAQSTLDTFLAKPENLQSIEQAALLMIESLKNKHAIYSCGNGGSMSDAMHFAEELTGRYRDNRAALPATAISDPGHISCVANDFGYAFIFSRYLEARASKGDCLLAISTSGTSENVFKAAEYAKENGIKVISLTGKEHSKIGNIADVDICAPGGQYADRTQEMHIKIIHILIELIERHFYPENYLQQK